MLDEKLIGAFILGNAMIGGALVLALAALLDGLWFAWPLSVRGRKSR